MSDSDCVESPSLAGGEGGACGGPQGTRSRAHARPGNLPKNRIVTAMSSRHMGGSSASSARRSSSASEKPEDPNENSDPHTLAEPNELVALEDGDEGVGVDGGGAMPRKANSTCRPHCDGLLPSSRRQRSSAGSIYSPSLANLILHTNP